MANLVRAGCDPAILPFAAQRVLARTPHVGGRGRRLSSDQCRSAHTVGLANSEYYEAACASGRVVCRFCFCATPRAGGIRGLDLGAKEHAVRSLLSGLSAHVSALRLGPSEVKIPAGNGSVCAGTAE